MNNREDTTTHSVNSSSNSNITSSGELFQLYSICCPCVILRDMRRIQHASVLSQYTTFLYSGALCLVCWPCSPMFAIYLCLQRLNLRRIYDGDDLQDPRLALSYLSMCNWHETLCNHYNFLLSKKSEGTLLFDWEYYIENTRSCSISDHVVYVVGSKGSGKSELISKLLLASRAADLSADSSSGFSRYRAGVRPVEVAPDGDVKFLEVWEVPEDKVGPSLRMALEKRRPDCVVFAADITNSATCDSIHYLYKEISSAFGLRAASVHFVCAITKFDMYDPRRHALALNRIKSWSQEYLLPVVEHSSFGLLGLNALKSTILSNDEQDDQMV